MLNLLYNCAAIMHVRNTVVPCIVKTDQTKFSVSENNKI